MQLLSNTILVSAVLLVVLAAALHVLGGTDERRVASRLTSIRPMPQPFVLHFVDRPEIGAIMATVAAEGNFLIVEGGNRMGKSTAVEAAAARMSHSRSVSVALGDPNHNANTLLREMMGLATTSLWEQLLSVRARDMGKLIEQREVSSPEPVSRRLVLALTSLFRARGITCPPIVLTVIFAPPSLLRCCRYSSWSAQSCCLWRS